MREPNMGPSTAKVVGAIILLLGLVFWLAHILAWAWRHQF